MKLPKPKLLGDRELWDYSRQKLRPGAQVELEGVETIKIFGKVRKGGRHFRNLSIKSWMCVSARSQLDRNKDCVVFLQQTLDSANTAVIVSSA